MSLEFFRRRLGSFGLDLVYPFAASKYEKKPSIPLPPGRDDCVVLLVGNTKALWRPMLENFRGRAFPANPVDDYCVRVIESVVQDAKDRGIGCFGVKYAHDVGKGLISMVSCAGATGEFYIAPEYLAVHPVFGPWVAFRGIIILDEPVKDDLLSLRPLPRPYSLEVAEEMARCFAAAKEDPTWENWLAVREACSLQEHRYPRPMMMYHYTHDPKYLIAEI